MKLTLNGTMQQFADDLTVADLLAQHLESTKGVAVAVNAEVVPKSIWAAHRLADGDQVEVLKAAQGG